MELGVIGLGRMRTHDVAIDGGSSYSHDDFAARGEFGGHEETGVGPEGGV